MPLTSPKTKTSLQPFKGFSNPLLYYWNKRLAFAKVVVVVFGVIYHIRWRPSICKVNWKLSKSGGLVYGRRTAAVRNYFNNWRSLLGVIFACLRILAKVPFFNSLWAGTMIVVLPTEWWDFRNLMWLPLCEIKTKPSFVNALTASFPEILGSFTLLKQPRQEQ